MHVNHRHSGSALLITLLMMGVLTIFGLGLGSLLVREIRVQAEAMRAAQSLYAAEGAVERGLLANVSHTVGYTMDAADAVEGDYQGNNAHYAYTITGASTTVPCFYERARVMVDDDGYQSLSPEETIRIPLFYEDADGTIVTTVDWALSYTAKNVAEFRWKLFGLTDQGHTEVMNDTVSVLANTIGTVSSTDYANYENTAADDDGTFSYTKDSYSIQQFLSTHTYPYLVLTNLSSADNPVVAPISFKLSATGNTLVTCEYARVSGDGQIDPFTVQQSIDALIHIDTPLPIFDFVLYQPD